MCFGTIVADLVPEFRSLGTMAPHPDSQVHANGHGPGLRDRGRTGKLSMSKSKEHIHLRFQAVVIASQLPDDRAEALLVLDYARQMVVEFLDDTSGVSDLTPPRVRDGDSIAEIDRRQIAAGDRRPIGEARPRLWAGG